ncbi:uncharacterized protein K452DRAFT_299208 [Aplosporella prunicola CBS 121167]|uniref:TLDc domain-containing protein n=1 Tax=Aplosporella prunicola CBS 121167 TaxID=1176127 RepID=A0A6A6B8G7_9PEZI|nr:uncharacterized protein K452DRAFT_299208 [Aplosporella prunicola CBS 121167]KAF2140449.1 hypothetical protein K452DRAFT_299208 [Aplosporella prunicola CBS 121167]
MGLGPSVPRRSEPTTPEEIRTKLIDFLYAGQSQDFLTSLRSSFLERCSEDGTLTRDAFVELLAEGEGEDYAEMLHEGGPILYRLAIYHGFYPFAPATDARLTCDAFLLSLAMMTHPADNLGQIRIGRRYLRDTEDIIRLCFQAVAQPSFVAHPENDDKNADRDFYSVFKNFTDNDDGVKIPYSPPLLPPDAPPCSSRDRSGVIMMQDMRNLVKLMLSLSMSTPPPTYPESLPVTAECICRSFGDADVDLPTFRSAVTEHLPNLFQPLRAFIARRFRILDGKPLAAAPPPPLAVSSKIISAPQTSQLRFMLHAAIPETFEELLHSGAPSYDAAEAASLLIHPKKDRLLLVSARNANTTRTFAVFICSEEFCEYLQHGSIIHPEAGYYRSCSMELAPQHGLLFASRHEREEGENVRTKIIHDHDGLVLQQGQGIWRFSEGLERVELVRPDKTEKFEVSWLEIWGA